MSKELVRKLDNGACRRMTVHICGATAKAKHTHCMTMLAAPDPSSPATKTHKNVMKCLHSCNNQQ